MADFCSKSMFSLRFKTSLIPIKDKMTVYEFTAILLRIHLTSEF